MNYKQLVDLVQEKKSFLCVGLDTDIDKLPAHLPKSPEGILLFNKAIIEATKKYAVAYKINTAFYESFGAEGWQVMEETVANLPENTFRIADAKRGDIGNTAAQYAKAFFEKMSFDAVTLSPYMGLDTFEPFLAYPDKWIIPLALTSNKGSNDFQKVQCNETAIFAILLKKMSEKLPQDRTMFVVGATNPEAFRHIRQICPEHFLLVPGVGAQGGTVEDLTDGFTKTHPGMLVNVSRGIIFAGKDENFAEKASEAAATFQNQMRLLLS